MTEAYPTMSVGYDIETFPNCFLFTWAWYGNPEAFVTYEISPRRNDIVELLQFLEFCRVNQVEMIGFNNIGFDYPVCHFIFANGTGVTVDAIYQKAMSIINSQDRFTNTIWDNERIAPQIDLFKIHHFDNKAKTQSLKGLEFNMKSANVQEMPVAVGTFLTSEEIDILIKYNHHDVRETLRFARISEENVKFRREMKSQLTGDVLNFNDTKIGKQIFEQRLGEELCYDRSSGKKVPRQTYRPVIDVGSIIFPYIKFEHPEFNRILDWLRVQKITETKGVFADVTATINGFDFHFGTGGIHGSVNRKFYKSDEYFAIIDVDVAALYPSIGIVNGLYPAHLGSRFTEVWSEIVAERGKWAKGTPQNASLKLANNGPYGDSNNVYSPLYDPQFTMTITINGQLLLCVLAEWLLKIPTLEIIQINTDGITFIVARQYEAEVAATLKRWEEWSRLKLEQARYGRMFIRDVNGYIAETEPDEKGKRKVKRKNAYEYYPTAKDISNASPSAWHKDLGGQIIARAAEAQMLHGIPVEVYIDCHLDPFDFMLRAKVDRRSVLFIGETQVQRICRYYVAKNGAAMSKRSPPTSVEGSFKRRSGITDQEYYSIRQELVAAGTPDAWDERIHTKNKSVHKEREMSFVSGWLVAECNDASKFDWSNVDKRYYIEEAKKLIIQ